jgi:hypothetical protein
MLSISMICMPAGKRWDEHILLTVVVLYLNAHPDMLTKDVIIVTTAALTDAFLSEGGAGMTPEAFTRKQKKLGFTPQKSARAARHRPLLGFQV